MNNEVEPIRKEAIPEEPPPSRIFNFFKQARKDRHEAVRQVVEALKSEQERLDPESN